MLKAITLKNIWDPDFTWWKQAEMNCSGLLFTRSECSFKITTPMWSKFSLFLRNSLAICCAVSKPSEANVNRTLQAYCTCQKRVMTHNRYNFCGNVRQNLKRMPGNCGNMTLKFNWDDKHARARDVLTVCYRQDFVPKHRYCNQN